MPTPTYICWQNMNRRCYDPGIDAYPWYGGRGIQVCGRWRTFKNFLKDMGERPAGMTLERKNNDGNYKPSNCRWATRHDQFRNRRGNHFLTIFGKRLCLTDWARASGIDRLTISERLRRGWSARRAITQPVDERIWNGRRNAA